MKVLICNTLKEKGGAAKSAIRIKEAVERFEEVNAQYVYLYENGEEKSSIIPKIDALPKLLFPKYRKFPFSCSIFSFGGKSYIKKYSPEILHLNYINMGMFSIKEIGDVQLPIVWTLHDAWTFTGGCHLIKDCTNYKKENFKSQPLSSRSNFDLSTHILRLKEKHWKNKNMVFVCPSYWMAKEAKESYLLQNKKILVIRNPLNTDIYKPTDRLLAREKLGLKKDGKYILFGSVDPLKDKNKGFEFLKEALSKIKNPSDITLVMFGTDEVPQIDRVEVKTVGYITNEQDLAELYSAMNATVVPSISENLPNVLIESISCGTPGVAFAVGGIPEIIENDFLGKTVKPFNIEMLARALEEVLENSSAFKREKMHTHIENNYGYQTVGKQYLNLYKSLVS